MDTDQHSAGHHNPARLSRVRAYFIVVALLTLIGVVGGLGLAIERGALWAFAGVFIGSLVPALALFNFYMTRIWPYRRAGKRELWAMESPVITQELPAPSEVIWRWALPSVVVAWIVYLGFLVGIGMSPFRSDGYNVYTHAFELGRVYNASHQLAETYDAESLRDLDSSVEDAARRQSDLEAIALARFGHVVELDAASSPEDQARRVLSAMTAAPYMIAFAFSFLGALIFVLRDELLRVFMRDLYPRTFISYIIRFLFAPSLALVIAHLSAAAWPSTLGPLVFFGVGFFPTRALQFIEKKSMGYLRLEGVAERSVPLTAIQGMGAGIVYRFMEMGIRDAQHLAYADLSYLMNDVGYCNRQLCDFVSQALLLVHAEEDFRRLQLVGIRGMVVFVETTKDGALEELAAVAGVPHARLKTLSGAARSPTVMARVEALKKLIEIFDEAEASRIDELRS